jgi:hypothetical protein
MVTLISLATLPVSIPASGADGATVSINGGTPINLAVGASQANVPIAISNLPSLGAGNGVGNFTINLSWNKSVVNIESSVSTSISGWSILPGQPDNETGNLQIVGLAMLTGFLTANTTIATLTVKGMAAGSATINLTIDALGDKNGATIASTTQNCAVIVGGGGGGGGATSTPTPTPTPTPTATPTPIPTTTPTATPSPTSTTKYSLNISINGKGSVNPASGSTHNAGTSVSLTATPDSGWKFSSWSGDLSGSSSPASLTMNANKSVTARFEQVAGATYYLYVTVNGVGTSNPIARIEPYTHPSGSTVNLTATAGPGWKFVSWGGDAADPGTAATTVVMNSEKYVVANFIQESGPTKFNLKMTADGDGDTDPMPGTHNYNAGQSVALKATPGAGWRFVRWNGSGIANPSVASTTLFINSEKTVEAVFERGTAKPAAAATTTTSAQGTGNPGKGPFGLEIWQFVLVVIGGLAVLTGLGILLKKGIANAMYRV